MKKNIPIKYLITLLLIISSVFIIKKQYDEKIISQLNLTSCIAYQIADSVMEVRYPNGLWSYDVFELNQLDGNEIRFWRQKLPNSMVMSIGRFPSYTKDFFPGYEKSELNFENSVTISSTKGITRENLEYLISPNFTEQTFTIFFNRSELPHLDQLIVDKVFDNIKIYQSDKLEKKAIITQCRN